MQPNPGSSSGGGGAVSAPVASTHLPTPAATSIASSVHALNLQQTALNVQTSPIAGGIHPDVTTLNYSTYLGGPGEDGLTAAATDNEGNIYVAGYFEVSPGTIQVYVASLNEATGMMNWQYALSGGYGPRDEGHGIAVVDTTASGGGVNVYVTGWISNNDSAPLAPTDGFVALLNGADGSIQQAFDLGYGNAQGIVVDPNTAFVFISGTSTDPTTGNQSIMTTAFDLPLATQAYTVNIPLQDANGNSVQGFVHGSQSIAIDPEDDVYIMGTLISANGTDMSPVLVAYNGFNNQSLWQPINFPNPSNGGPGYGSAVVYQEFSLYVTGTLYDDNGGTPLNSDLLLARLPRRVVHRILITPGRSWTMGRATAIGVAMA